MGFKPGYKAFIEERFKIVDKSGKTVPFELNKVQERYLLDTGSGRDIILKARQQGFSSMLLGVFTADFLLKENVTNVVVADKRDNAEALLERVKFFIRSYEEITNTVVPLKYNSKYELHLEGTNSKYIIGTAENREFGRSKTITNLHLSEAAFYPDFARITASAMQAVVPDGRVIMETTANGFNEFKGYWDNAVAGTSTMKPLFFKASDFYDAEFLERKKLELGRLFTQEYPETPEEAFLTSGDPYFDPLALKDHLDRCIEPIREGLIYV